MIGILGAIGWHAMAKLDSDSMDMVINGAGYDLALAFAALQVPVTFASAITNGKTAELLKMDLAEHGINDYITTNESLPFTGSVAWYEYGTEKIMRAHPSFDISYPESYLESLIEKCDVLIVELGHKNHTLTAIDYFIEKHNKKLIWIIRTKKEWDKLLDNKLWQRHNTFIGPHASDFWPDYINKMPQLKEIGFAAITKTANMTMLWQNEDHIMLPIADATVHPEYRFSNVVASIVNEMHSWQLSLFDATKNCAGAFEEWVDLQDTGGADLERKVATFYKKVENLEHDALTGLLSRGAAEKILVSGKLDSPLTMILVDVDHFKRVNDTLGHHIGDQVLVSVAHKIARETRDKDLAVRWGGEEFVILLPGCPISRAVSIAERVRLGLHQITTEIGKITASFGVAERLEHETLEDWFIRVDTRLYFAKNNGRDQIVDRDHK